MGKTETVMGMAGQRSFPKLRLAASASIVMSLVIICFLFSDASAQNEKRSLNFSGYMNGEEVMDTGWAMADASTGHHSSAVFSIWPFNR